MQEAFVREQLESGMSPSDLRAVLLQQLEALDREQEGVAARQAAQDFPASSGELEEIPESDPSTNAAIYEIGPVHKTARDAFGDVVVVRPQPAHTMTPASVPQQLSLGEGTGLVTAGLVTGDELRSATERLNRLETGEQLPHEFVARPGVWQQKLEDAVVDAQRKEEQQRRWRVAQQLAHSSVSLHGPGTPVINHQAAGTNGSGCGELEDCDIVAHAGEHVLTGVMRGIRVPDRFRFLFVPQPAQQTDSEKSATAEARRQLAELFAIQIAEQLQREVTEVTVHRVHLENGSLTIEYQTTAQRQTVASVVASVASPGDSEHNAGGRHGLHACAAQGDERSVRLLLDRGYVADTRDTRRRTALHLAANLAVAKTLILAGASVNVVDRQGNTPLHAAVKPQIVALLLEKGAKINAANKFGSTPLHLAAASSAAVTEALLNAHPPADVHLRNSGGETPMHMAVDGETVRLLANAGCDVGVAIPRVNIVALPTRKVMRTKEQQKAFTKAARLAAAGEWAQAVRQWDELRQGCGESGDEPVEPANPLWLACQRKCIEVERNRGRLAQALDRLNEAIGLLCASDPTLLAERAALLMEMGRLQDAHNDLETAGQVGFILDSGDAQALSHLREELAATRAAAVSAHFGAVHVRGHYTPLHTARKGEVVAALIKLRADVHAQTEFRITPLHCACDAQAVMELIRAKAHVNASAANHRTPLHAAAARQHGSREIVKVLLEHKANPNAGDKYRERPLHLAHDPGVCQLLVEYKANIDAQDVHGNTALQVVTAAAAKAELAAADSAPVDPNEDLEQRVANAAKLRESAEQFTRDALQQQHTRMIETLITLGASTKIASASGETAPDMAARLHAHQTARRLGANDADSSEKADSPIPAKSRADSEDNSQLPEVEQREDAELAHQSLQAERMQALEHQRNHTAQRRGLPEQDWNLGLDAPVCLEIFSGQAFELYGSGKITTKPYLWPSEEQMRGKHLFVDFEGGSLRVALLAHDTGNAIAPFTVANCTPIRCINGRANAFGEPVWWRSSMGIDGRDLSSLVRTVGNGRRLAVRLHFEVDNGALFGAYITDAIPQSTELTVPEAAGKDLAGLQLEFDLNEQTYIVSIPDGLKSGEKFTTSLPPRAARRGPTGGLGADLTLAAPRNWQQPTNLTLQGFLPLPSMDIVRELVRLGFEEPVSKRAAAETAGGGLTAASKWAQQVRGGVISSLCAAPPPLAAGRWRLDSCLAPLDPNRSGYLLLAHTTEPIELALVEEGIGRVVGMCVRGGNKTLDKTTKADEKKPTTTAAGKTGADGIVCTARMRVNSQWFDWASSFSDVFCRRYAAELAQPTFCDNKDHVPSVQIERHTVNGVNLPVMLETGDEVLLKIRLQKLPSSRDWPTGEKRTARTRGDDDDSDVEDDFLLQDTEVPALIEGWRDLTSELKKEEGMVVHTPFAGGRTYVSEQLIHKKRSAQPTGCVPVPAEISMGIVMGFEGWNEDSELRTATEEMPPPSVYSGIRAAQSCTALPAGEYSWPAASTTAGSWCVRVLDDGRLELRYGGASSAGAPAWAAKFGILLSPDGNVRCLSSRGKLQELHQPSKLSLIGSKAQPCKLSPSVDPDNMPKKIEQKKATKAAKPKPVALDPTLPGKAKRSARAVAERLAADKAAADSAKAAALFFASGKDTGSGPRVDSAAVRSIQAQDAEERRRQQRSFFDRAASAPQESAQNRSGGFGSSGFVGGGRGGGFGGAAVSGDGRFGGGGSGAFGAGRSQAPTAGRPAGWT